MWEDELIQEIADFINGAFTSESRKLLLRILEGILDKLNNSKPV